MDEQVVLVDTRDIPIGTAMKRAVHTDNTPLHRGFSVFLFNEKHEVLVQQRAKEKITWPLAWSNSCCGHPLPNETYEAAVSRRVLYELGILVHELQKVRDYRYRFERGGVVEHEICPVFIGKVTEAIQANPTEVAAWKWVDWEDFLKELREDRSGKWSEWCKEEAELVDHWMIDRMNWL